MNLIIIIIVVLCSITSSDAATIEQGLEFKCGNSFWTNYLWLNQEGCYVSNTGTTWVNRNWNQAYTFCTNYAGTLQTQLVAEGYQQPGEVIGRLATIPSLEVFNSLKNAGWGDNHWIAAKTMNMVQSNPFNANCSLENWFWYSEDQSTPDPNSIETDGYASHSRCNTEPNGSPACMRFRIAPAAGNL